MHYDPDKRMMKKRTALRGHEVALKHELHCNRDIRSVVLSVIWWSWNTLPDNCSTDTMNEWLKPVTASLVLASLLCTIWPKVLDTSLYTVCTSPQCVYIHMTVPCTYWFCQLYNTETVNDEVRISKVPVTLL